MAARRPGRQQWGPQRWALRPVRSFAADAPDLQALRAAALRARETALDDHPRAVLDDLLAQLAVLPPGAGSTVMEARSTNTRGSGLLDVLGALTFHDNDPRRNNAGLPDILAVLGPVLFLAEHKPAGGRPSAMQALWLERLAQVRYVWSGCVQAPDWGAFVEVCRWAYLLGQQDRVAAGGLPADPPGDYTDSTLPGTGSGEGDLS